MVEEQEPVIDWSKDEDVVSLAKITDSLVTSGSGPIKQIITYHVK